MGHGCLVRSDGDFLIPLLGDQHTSVQRGDQHYGIFLPEHVQRYPVRLDARGLSSTYSGYSLRCSQLLGSIVQYCIALDRCPPLSPEHQRASLSGRIWGFCVHHMHCADAAEIHGRQELLSFEFHPV